LSLEVLVRVLALAAFDHEPNQDGFRFVVVELHCRAGVWIRARFGT
jgi:hypothetical protein